MMASALPLPSSMALRSLSAPHTKRLLVGHNRPNPILPRHAFSRSVLTFSRRRNNNSAITSSSSKKKKKSLPHNNVKEEEDLDEDAFEALFNQLEEDLKNDDQSSDDGDDEISEEDLAKLERELEEAFGDDELLRALDSTESSKNDNEANEEEEDDGDGDDDDGDEIPVKLKNWQLRRLAYALKNGRRKTSIKNLAAELCLDRAAVLEFLRDPPPNLLLMSAALPDKPVPTISEPETKPMETVSLDTSADVAEPEAKVEVPVHVMQSRWSAQKRLKKVQVETLERVYKRTRRPTNAMISSIVHVTNLPRKRVVKWFEDKRTEDGVPEHRLPYHRSAPETVFTR
uniref:Homeobox domain-containing protein n=1 Tax=Davidia involucrata TaxID=16924 RepID=A0A5B6YKY1_DAVIN